MWCRTVPNRPYVVSFRVLLVPRMRDTSVTPKLSHKPVKVVPTHFNACFVSSSSPPKTCRLMHVERALNSFWS